MSSVYRGAVVTPLLAEQPHVYWSVATAITTHQPAADRAARQLLLTLWLGLHAAAVQIAKRLAELAGLLRLEYETAPSVYCVSGNDRSFTR